MYQNKTYSTIYVKILYNYNNTYNPGEAAFVSTVLYILQHLTGVTDKQRTDKTTGLTKLKFGI